MADNGEEIGNNSEGDYYVASLYGMIQSQEVEAVELLEDTSYPGIMEEMVEYKRGKTPPEIFAAWKVLTVSLLQSANANLPKMLYTAVSNVMSSYVYSMAMTMDDEIEALAQDAGLEYRGFADDE